MTLLASFRPNSAVCNTGQIKLISDFVGLFSTFSDFDDVIINSEKCTSPNCKRKKCLARSRFELATFDLGPTKCQKIILKDQI